MMSDAELMELARTRLLGRTVEVTTPWRYRGQVIAVRMREEFSPHRPVVVIQALDAPMTGTLLADVALSSCTVIDSLC